MINYLMDCSSNTPIAKLPEILTHNNKAIENEFSYIFDPSANRLTKSVYVPQGHVKAHFGEFTNLYAEYLTVKHPESFKISLEEYIKTFSHQLLEDRFSDDASVDDASMDIIKTQYAHDAKNIYSETWGNVEEGLAHAGVIEGYYYEKGESSDVKCNVLLGADEPNAEQFENNHYVLTDSLSKVKHGYASISLLGAQLDSSVTNTANIAIGVGATIDSKGYSACNINIGCAGFLLSEENSNIIRNLLSSQNNTQFYNIIIGGHRNKIQQINASTLYNTLINDVSCNIQNSIHQCIINSNNCNADSPKVVRNDYEYGTIISSEDCIEGNGHIFGSINSIASLNSVIIGGKNLFSLGQGQVVIGRYNNYEEELMNYVEHATESTYIPLNLFVVGNGGGPDGEELFSNAFAVKTTGDVSVLGDISFLDASTSAIKTISALLDKITELENRIAVLEGR